MTNLVLERKDQPDQTLNVGPAAITPLVDESYWTYRVRLTEGQAIVGFPKFSTIGIGFAVEEDWNTNLPFTCDAEEIYNHISHNAGNSTITADACIEAIRLIQAAVAADGFETHVVTKIRELAATGSKDAAIARKIGRSESRVREIREQYGIRSAAEGAVSA